MKQKTALQRALDDIIEIAHADKYYHGDNNRVYTTADQVLNILASVTWGHLRQDFIDWLTHEIESRGLTVEQGVLVGAGALDWCDR